MYRSASRAVLALLGACGFTASPPSSQPTDGNSASDDAGGTGGSSTDGSPAIDAAIDGSTPIALVDRGLVVRYFIDEAASGQSPASLTDAAPNPVSLPITFGQATFVEIGGNRGLSWATSQGTGKLELALGGNKIGTRLIPARTVTIEVVAQITSAGGTGSESNVTGMRGSNPDFVLTALGASDFKFYRPFGNEGASWASANTQQRMVLHLVFDSTKPAMGERIELFRNGTQLTKTTSSPPAMNQQVALGGSDDFMIGNSQGSNRSIGGTIFYVAYYDVALTAAEITTNAMRLAADDDH